MNTLINYLSNLIIEQINVNSTNIIRVENFDNPGLYRKICENLKNNTTIDHFVAKLALEKYKEFQSANNLSWNSDLAYLNQGNNPALSDELSEMYKDNSYVDFNNAITKWRNESASERFTGTSLILLLGTEAATDIGGLSDTSFVVSPKEIIEVLKDDYSLWFDHLLEINDLKSSETKVAIHTLYKALFSGRNVNLFKLSSFVDQAEKYTYTTIQDLIEYICETLHEQWDIPSIFDEKEIPRANLLSSGQIKKASIITDAIKFIDRADDIPTERKINTYIKQFAKYADEKGIVVSDPFETESEVFASYNEFRDVVIGYICGKSINENRIRLMKVDYATIKGILGTKLPKVNPKVSIKPMSGEPIDALAKIIMSQQMNLKGMKIYSLKLFLLE